MHTEMCAYVKNVHVCTCNILRYLFHENLMHCYYKLISSQIIFMQFDPYAGEKIYNEM